MRFAAQGSHRELIALRAGLDRIEVGTVLLDQWRNVQFVNRAFRRIWRVPEELCDAKPTFARLLMFHGRNGEGSAVPSAQFDACIQAQLDLIRTGDEQPLDVRFARRGLSLRLQGLPDGGRFLSYGNVADLIRHRYAVANAPPQPTAFSPSCRDRMGAFSTLWANIRHARCRHRRFKSINDKYRHDISDRAVLKLRISCAAASGPPISSPVSGARLFCYCRKCRSTARAPPRIGCSVRLPNLHYCRRRHHFSYHQRQRQYHT